MSTRESHPAPYSEPILHRLASLLEHHPRPLRLHDPYAGDGLGLDRLAHLLGRTDVSGTELEAAYILSTNVKQGNAVDRRRYPRVPYVLVTSPVYPNGVADNNRPRDASTRLGYLASLMAITGNPDYQLHPDSMCALGYRGTQRDGASTKRVRYWNLARQAISCWGGATELYVNVSDFYSGDEIEPLVDDWARELREFGWDQQERHLVSTARYGYGQNGSKRVEHEAILQCTRSDRG